MHIPKMVKWKREGAQKVGFLFVIPTIIKHAMITSIFLNALTLYLPLATNTSLFPITVKLFEIQPSP